MDEADSSRSPGGEDGRSGRSIPASHRFSSPRRQLQARSALPKRAPLSASYLRPGADPAAAGPCGEGSGVREFAASSEAVSPSSPGDGGDKKPAAAAAVAASASDMPAAAAAERHEAVADEEDFFVVEAEGDPLLEAEILCLPLADAELHNNAAAAGAERTLQASRAAGSEERVRGQSHTAAAAVASGDPRRGNRAAVLIAEQAARWSKLYEDDSLGEVYLLLQQRLQRRLLALGALCTRGSSSAAALAAKRPRRQEEEQQPDDRTQQQKRLRRGAGKKPTLAEGEATRARSGGEEVTPKAGRAAAAAARREKRTAETAPAAKRAAASAAAGAATTAAGAAAAAAASEPDAGAAAERENKACAAAEDASPLQQRQQPRQAEVCRDAKRRREEAEEAAREEGVDEADELVLRLGLLQEIIHAGQQNEHKTFQAGWVNCVRSRKQPASARRYFGAKTPGMPPAAVAGVAAMNERRTAAARRRRMAAAGAAAATKPSHRAAQVPAAADVTEDSRPAAAAGAAAGVSAAEEAAAASCSVAGSDAAAASPAAGAGAFCTVDTSHATPTAAAGEAFAAKETKGRPLTAADGSSSGSTLSQSPLTYSWGKEENATTKEREEGNVGVSSAATAGTEDATRATTPAAVSAAGAAAGAGADTATETDKEAAEGNAAVNQAAAAAEGVTANVATGDGYSFSAATEGIRASSRCNEATTEEKKLVDVLVKEEVSASSADCSTATSPRESESKNTPCDDAAGAARQSDPAAGAAGAAEARGHTPCSATPTQTSGCAADAAAADAAAADAAAADTAAAGGAAAAFGAVAASEAAAPSFLRAAGVGVEERGETGGRQQKEEEEDSTTNVGEVLTVAVDDGQLSVSLAELQAHDSFLFTVHQMRRTICYFCGRLSCPRSADGRISCPESRCEHCYEKGHRSCSKTEALRSPVCHLVDSRFQLRYHFGHSAERLPDRRRLLRQQQAAAVFLPADLQYIRCIRCGRRGHFLCGRAPAQDGYATLSVRMSVSLYDTHAKQNVLPDFVWSREEAAAFYAKLPREVRRRLDEESSSCASTPAHRTRRERVPPPPPSPPLHSHSGRYSAAAVAAAWSHAAGGASAARAAAAPFGRPFLPPPRLHAQQLGVTAAGLPYESATDLPSAALLRAAAGEEEARGCCPPPPPYGAAAPAAAAAAASGRYAIDGRQRSSRCRSPSSPGRRAADDARLLLQEEEEQQQQQHTRRSSGRTRAGTRQGFVKQQEFVDRGGREQWTSRRAHPYTPGPAAGAAGKTDEPKSWRSGHAQGSDFCENVCTFGEDEPLPQTPFLRGGPHAHRGASPQQLQQHPACGRRVTAAAAAAEGSRLRERHAGGSGSDAGGWDPSVAWPHAQDSGTGIVVTAGLVERSRGGDLHFSQILPPSSTFFHPHAMGSSNTHAHTPGPVLLRPADFPSDAGPERKRRAVFGHSPSPAAAAAAAQQQQGHWRTSPGRHTFVEKQTAREYFAAAAPARDAAPHASGVSPWVYPGQLGHHPSPGLHAHAVDRSSGYYVGEAAPRPSLQYVSPPFPAGSGHYHEAPAAHAGPAPPDWRRLQVSPVPEDAGRNLPQPFPMYAAASHTRRPHRR